MNDFKKTCIFWCLQLLSLPLLKKVRIEHSLMSCSEMEELLLLVRQKRILQNVVSVEWCNRCNPYEKFLYFGLADKALFD